MAIDIARIENRLLVISQAVGAPVYDYDLAQHFTCTHPYEFIEGELCILRIGAVKDYQAQYAEKSDWGLRLINSPNEHSRASELEAWYPIISDLTPTSMILDDFPPAERVGDELGWPVFVKGSRQTSKHNPALSVAKNPAEYRQLIMGYRKDPILHWQRPIIRQFVELERLPGQVPNKIQPSLEFRTFWWNGAFVGCGHYWYQLPKYGASDLDAGLEIAQEVATRVSVPFLVVDIARTNDGRWTVIECNDAQEAGYVGLSPQLLWRNILDRME